MIELIKTNYKPFLIGAIISYVLFTPRVTTTTEFHATTKVETTTKTITKNQLDSRCTSKVTILPDRTIEVEASSKTSNETSNSTSVETKNENVVKSRPLQASRHVTLGVSIEIPSKWPLEVSKELIELSIGIPISDSWTVEGSYRLDGTIGLGIRLTF